jgi:hypothetical protein
MRRLLRWIAILVALALAIPAALAATLYAVGPERRTALQLRLMSDGATTAPDYASPDAWAALPDRADGADVALLPGTADQQSQAAADVFYLHAGVNFGFDWNAALDSRTARFLVDGPYMARFASVFNGCCRIYAPRYRQESLTAPAGDRSTRSLDTAYADVRAAFRHYMERWNDGRPIVVAGSQSGGRHALRLLVEEFAGKPLRAQLVTAYLVGAAIDAEKRGQLADVAICDAPDALGCVNVWSAAGRQGKGHIESRDAACVNPLSWRADSAHVPAEHNHGSIVSSGWYDAPIAVHVGQADAQCEGGWLWVTPPPFDAEYWQPFGPGDYHIYNYALFFADLRENAILRVGRFVKAASASAAR